MVVPCPVCDAEINIDEQEFDEGDTLTCDECGADLRVASLDPPELESLDDDEEEEEEESLDYDDEDEEEDEEEDESWK